MTRCSSAIQRDLFSLGALLATPDPDKVREHLEKARIGDARIAELERAIDDGERSSSRCAPSSCRAAR